MIKTVAVIGSGKMGRDIFTYLLSYNYNLIWCLSRHEDIDNVQTKFTKKFERLNSRRDKNNGVLISFTKKLSDLSSADLVIEAITESFESKQKLFTDLDAILKGDCIIATNSSSIHPDNLIISKIRGDKIAGLHFFYPMKIKEVVEVSFSQDAGDILKSEVCNFISSIDKKIFELDRKSFQILNVFALEIQLLIYEIYIRTDVEFKDLESITKDIFFTSGVLEMVFSIGYKTFFNSISNYIDKGFTLFDDKRRYEPFREFIKEIFIDNEGTYDVKSLNELDNNDNIQKMFKINIELNITQAEIIEIIETLTFYYFNYVIDKTGLKSESLNFAISDYFSMDRDIIKAIGKMNKEEVQKKAEKIISGYQLYRAC